MGRARRNMCRLCMKPTNRGEISTINNLPKTFAHILEEISGLKFTQADGLQMTVCVRCKDFLNAMENHSQYPKSNKISGAGKKKVRRLMDKGFSAAEAIEKVIAEKRARDLLSGTGAPVQGAPTSSKPNVNVVQNAGGVPDDRRRMSGAQRKKVQILLAAGVDRLKARELVIAASGVRGEGTQQLQGGPAQRGTTQRGVGQRNAVLNAPGRRGVEQRPVGPKGSPLKAPPQRGAAQQRGPGQKGAVQQGGPVQKGAVPQRAPAQKGAVPQGGQKGALPLNGTAQKGPGQKAPAQKGAPQRAMNAPNQKGQVPAAAAAGPQQRRQANPNGGKAQNPRRNERTAPYNNRGNNRQQNDNFNQQSNPLEVGIVPINFPNVQLDDMKLEALKEAITNEIFKIPQGGPLVRFLGTSSQNGWLKLICADKLSYNWLSMLVSRWERAGLRMVEGSFLPQPVVLSLYLPGDFRTPEEILNILERQNNSLNTNQWRVINRETDANGQSITVCVDEQSFQALKSRDFMVFLGLGVVELKPRRFPSDGGTFNNAPMKVAMNNSNNRLNSGGGNNSQGYTKGGGGMGNNYQANRSNNSGGGGGNYQRQGNGQGYQRAGYQNQRSW